MTINKLAIVRSDNTHPCPFGLNIPLACQSVGTSIHDMQLLTDVPEDQREKYKQANRRVYRHSADGERCPFADSIMTGRDFVVCDYGDTGSGEHGVPFRASPHYPRAFIGLGQGTLYSYPLGTYNDSFPEQINDGIFQSYASTEESQNSAEYEFFGSLASTEQPADTEDQPANKTPEQKLPLLGT